MRSRGWGWERLALLTKEALTARASGSQDLLHALLRQLSGLDTTADFTHLPAVELAPKL